jgi:hypothetical protein
MAEMKPDNIEAYKNWLREHLSVAITRGDETYYESVTARMLSTLAASPFWTCLSSSIDEYHQEYLLATGYDLLLPGFVLPKLCIKPFGSFLDKTFRKNVLHNRHWPAAPAQGWIVPDSWYSRISDILRCTVVVKYLDGVEFMIEKIRALSETHGLPFSVHMEAREEGYYAAHVYTSHAFEVPRRNWDTLIQSAQLEIQITTQLQEVIQRLLHSRYEKSRSDADRRASSTWRWDYRSEEFAAGYLGHILHYVEGMIMEVRDRRKKE